MRAWAYPLLEDDDGATRVTGHFEVEMPEGASILSVEASSKSPVTLYALVEPELPAVTRHFFVAENDVELPDGAGAVTYQGTAKYFGGPTFHVFEVVAVAA